MDNNALPEYTPQVGRQYVAHMSNLARILSGELEGKGRAVKRLEITPHSPCATDGETVFLTYPIFPSVTDARMNIICTEAVLAHEAAGHLRYTNFNAWKKVTDGIKKGVEDKLLHDFVNIFEDARVNYLLGQDFGGSKKRLDFAQKLIMGNHKAVVLERGVTDEEAPKMGVLAIATEAIMGTGHFFDNPLIINMMNEARPLFATTIAGRDTSEVVKGARAVLAVYRTHFPEDECGGSEYGASKETCAEGIFADDMSMESIEEAANAQKREKKSAEKVDRKRFEDIKVPAGDNAGEGDSEDEGEPQEGAGAGDGEEGEGEPTDGALEGESVDGDGEGDSGEGESGGNDAGEGEGDESDGKTNAAGEMTDGEGEGETGDLSGDNHFAGLIAGGNGESDSVDDFTGTDYAENMLAEAGEIISAMDDMEFDRDGDLITSITYETGEQWSDRGHTVIVGKNPQWREGYISEVQEYNTVASTQRGGINRLAQSIKNLVKGADSRFSTHHKRGKLDTRRLYAHTSSDRVFKKDKVRPVFNLNCLILIDASGSMSGSRASNAAQAAVTLAEAMEKVGAEYEIVDFNSSNGAVTGFPCGATYINVRKNFNEALSTVCKQQIVTPFAGSQNSDGWAVKWAIERVKTYSAGDGAKNMVFVISDGSPAGPSPHGMTSNAHLRQVLKDAENDDTILFSVGIDGMDTGRYYGAHGYATVRNSDTLAQDIVVPLKVALKKAIKN